MAGAVLEGGRAAVAVSVLRRHRLAGCGPRQRMAARRSHEYALRPPLSLGNAAMFRLRGGLPDTLRDDHGLPAVPHAAQAPARALAPLPGDTALRDRLAERARATIEQQYSTEVVCGQSSARRRQLAGIQ
jgi:hypothetical protein